MSKEEDYKRGYENGKSSSIMDEIATKVSPFSSGNYDKGFADGLDHKYKYPNSGKNLILITLLIHQVQVMMKVF